MESISLLLPVSKKEISVLIERKNMKTCRLKVFPNLTVSLSVPSTVSAEWICSFLNDKSKWIESKLERFSLTAGYASTNEIRNGFSIKMLGEDLIFSVAYCSKNNIYREGKTICICTPCPNDQDRLMKQFESWWRNESVSFLKRRILEFYPIVQKYGVPLPTVQIRKMKTLWGSCSANRNVVTFNQYLIKAKPACVDYVVLHELVHFIYPNHSKQFYDFLSIYMPDWKERKRMLDMDVVHGL